MTARKQIPAGRIQFWLPKGGWVCLTPRETRTTVRLLRNYSQECNDEHGCGVVAADTMADKIERRARL